MEIVFTVLILLMIVALSGVGLSLLPVKLPLPLIQIAIGAMLAWPGFRLHVTFDPELFMLLFIPPLLFADGWRIPKRELYLARRAVLMLALGLVFITVGALGYFLHWMIPAMPLPSPSRSRPCFRRPMRSRSRASPGATAFRQTSCIFWKAKR